MKTRTKVAIFVALASLQGLAVAQTSAPTGKALEQELQQQSVNMPEMTAAQSATLRAEYKAAKAKWSTLSPQEQAAIVASARQKKIADLTAMERVGQRDDMLRETAAMSAQLKAEAAAADAAWAKLTPAQKQAARASAWKKKRAELDGMEAAGQRDDSYLINPAS